MSFEQFLPAQQDAQSGRERTVIPFRLWGKGRRSCLSQYKNAPSSYPAHLTRILHIYRPCCCTAVVPTQPCCAPLFPVYSRPPALWPRAVACHPSHTAAWWGPARPCRSSRRQIRLPGTMLAASIAASVSIWELQTAV